MDAADSRFRVVQELVAEAAALRVLGAVLRELEVAEGGEAAGTLLVQHSADSLVSVLPVVEAAERMLAGVAPVTLELTV